MQEYQSYKLNRIAEADQTDLITVIVACYNIETYIRRCVDSITAQTYKNLEILITDDGSTDSSGAICDELASMDPRIKVFHTDNHGLGLARDYAMDRASGTYITFVDGDDYIEPRMYEEMMAAMKSFDTDIVVAGYEDVYESKDTKEKSLSLTGTKESDEDYYISDLALMNSENLLRALVEEDEKYVVQNCAWNKLYKRSFVEEGDKLRFPEGHYEDIVYTTKLLSKISSGVVICDKLYNYITDRSGSIMNQGVKWDILTQQIPAYKARNKVLVDAGYPELAYIHQYMVYKKLLLLYTQVRRSKDPEKKAKMDALADVIRGVKDNYAKVYSCRIANPHQELRMKLFLKNTMLYNSFMAVNDTFIIPVKVWISNKL
jgi:glycosyltransferase involved in cell wall biosynthesis